MQNKWKNVKHDSRRRDSLIRKAVNQTGGGKISKRERRIIDSTIYADIASKMGLSSSGNEPRFDNDQNSNSLPIAPKRLRPIISQNDEDTENSLQSNSSFANLGLSSMSIDSTK